MLKSLTLEDDTAGTTKILRRALVDPTDRVNVLSPLVMASRQARPASAPYLLPLPPTPPPPPPSPSHDACAVGRKRCLRHQPRVCPRSPRGSP